MEPAPATTYPAYASDLEDAPHAPSSSVSPIGHSRYASVVAHAFVALYLTFFFWRALTGQGVFFWYDHAAIYLPLHIENSELRKSGQWPLWNRHCLMGYPSQAEHELNGLYPVTFIFDVMSDPVQAYSLYVVLHYAIAAYSMMFLMRRLRTGPAAQTAAALAYAFGGSMVGMNVGLTLMITLSWAPLVLGLLLRAYESRRWIDTVWAGLGLAIQALSAHPGGGLYMILVFVVLVASQFRGADRAKRLMRAAGTTVVAGLLGVAIAAPTLLYFSELMSRTRRAEGFTLYQSMFQSLPPHQYLQLILPDIFNNGRPGYALAGEERIYLGLIGLPLLLLGWNYAGRRRLLGDEAAKAGTPTTPANWEQPPGGYRDVEMRNAFRGLVVLGALLSLGRFGGLYRLLIMIPGYDTLNSPCRLVLMVSLGAAPLIGLGVERLVRGSLDLETFRKRSLQYAGGLTIFLGVLGITWGLFKNDIAPMRMHSSFVNLGRPKPEQHETFMSNAERWERYHGAISSTQKAASLALLTTLFFFGLGKFYSRSTAGYLACLMLAVDLFLSNTPMINRLLARPDFYDVSPPVVDRCMEFRRLCRVAGRKDTWGLVHRPNFESPQHNMAALLKIDAFNYDAAAKQTVVASLIQKLSQKQLGVFNVKYLVTPPKLGMQVRILPWTITSNPDFVPRITVREDVHVIPDPYEAIAFIDSDEFSLENSVAVAKEPDYLPGDRDSTMPAEPQIENLKYRAQQLSLDLTLSRPGVLVVSDLYYPGWHAWSNGRQVEILRANGLTRALALGPGRHHIKFEYWPLSFAIGLWISGITLSLVGLCLLWHVVRRFASGNPRPSPAPELPKADPAALPHPPTTETAESNPAAPG